MRTKEGYLQEVLTQLLRLDFEITRMKFWIEKAGPKVMTGYHQDLRQLRLRHKEIESYLQLLRDTEDEIWMNRHNEKIDHALQEMIHQIESIGISFRMQAVH